MRSSHGKSLTGQELGVGMIRIRHGKNSRRKEYIGTATTLQGVSNWTGKGLWYDKN